MGEDTDLLLGLLSSIVNTKDISQQELLEALVNANGVVERAAKALSKQKPANGKKRKRDGGLDDWLERAPALPSSAKHTSRSNMQIENSPSSSKIMQSRPARLASPSPSKPTVSLMSRLKQAPSSVPSVPRLAPFTLSTSALVARHTPCTLHHSILPQELACRLFYAMLCEASEWNRNKWWLFDRVVESPHKTSFYVRKTDGNEDNWHEAAQFWYNGAPTPPPNRFLPEMEEACSIIERVVNEQLQQRSRLPFEWAGDGSRATWRANVAASNCYTGAAEGVGPHSDHLTYLGPYPTIASLSLGTTRTFRLREVVPKDEAKQRHAQTFNIPLQHNTARLIIMHGGCQEAFKHSIPQQRTLDVFHPAFPPSDPDCEMLPPSTSRINITFRFYRPDYRPPSIPRCSCGIPTILRPDMKSRPPGSSPSTMKYWWVCYAGAQNEGKGCSYWKAMDAVGEGRGPFMKDLAEDSCSKASDSNSDQRSFGPDQI